MDNGSISTADARSRDAATRGRRADPGHGCVSGAFGANGGTGMTAT
jgi:hypothetical protein